MTVFLMAFYGLFTLVMFLKNFCIDGQVQQGKLPFRSLPSEDTLVVEEHPKRPRMFMVGRCTGYHSGIGQLTAYRTRWLDLEEGTAGKVAAKA